MRRVGLVCCVVLLLITMGGCADMLISDELREIMEQGTDSIAEIWEIEDENTFICELSMYIAEKCDYGTNLEVLSDPERVFYITQTLEMEVNNGGFWQFFYNVEEDVFCGVTAAFSEIGAEKTEELCRRAMCVFDQDLPNDRASRMQVLTELGMEEGYELLSELDEAFYAYEEDLNALNYAYVQKNKAAFS